MRDFVDHSAASPVRRKDTGTIPGFSSKRPQKAKVFQVAVSDRGVYPWGTKLVVPLSLLPV